MPFQTSDDCSNSVVRALFTSALESAALLHSILSLSAMHKYATTFYTDGNWQILHHRGSALQLLVKQLDRLEGSPNDALIATVILLSIYEASRYMFAKVFVPQHLG
jgi:hypothetical protein